MIIQKIEKGIFYFSLYGLFLRGSTASKAPTIAIVTIMATTPGTKWVSNVDGAVVVGAGLVVDSASTANAVTAWDG